MARRRMQEIHAQTQIPVKTLENWRRRLRQEDGSPPVYGRSGQPLKISAEVEAQVADRIREEFIQEGRYCPKAVVKAKVEEHVAEITGSKIEAGRTFLDNFLDRQGLSMRMPHVRRRTLPDDDQVASFLADMDASQFQFPDSDVFNIDETCWRLVNGRLRTLAVRGQDEVDVKCGADPKSDITVICGCSRSGDRLPIYLLAKGKTPRCTQRFRDSPQLRTYFASNDLVVDFSPTGWSTHEVMLRYLKWLRNLVKNRPFFVLWDVHASHRHAKVIEWARRHNVGLSFIPAGQTGVWQPLDRRIFGSLKARSLRLLNEDLIQEKFEDHNLMKAIAVLVRSWRQIPPEEIRRAWSVFDA